jgi:DNA helicase IV
VTQSSLKDDAEASETHQRVLPTKAGRHGPAPVRLGCASNGVEHAQIAAMVARFRALGIPAEEIAVLYPRDDRRRIDALCRELRRENAVVWISNDADPNGGPQSLARPGIRLSTIRKAKGLEFRAVVVAAVDQLTDPDDTVDANLLYVGLTRATDHLAVTWTGRSKFTDRIDGSTRAVAWMHEGGMDRT